MFRLLATCGSVELAFSIGEADALLGSSHRNNIVLRLPGISRRHAVIRRVAGGVAIEDLDSKNGLRIEGKRVQKAVLTPGLRIQVGSAWLQLQEISASEAILVQLQENRLLGKNPSPAGRTATVSALPAPTASSPIESALSLAFHIVQAGAGEPEERSDLLIRIQSSLEAEAFATLEATKSGRIRLWECIGPFTPHDLEQIRSLPRGKAFAGDGVSLIRIGAILLSGRGAWGVAARFAEERMAAEGWRREFLRFITAQFFPPLRSLDATASLEASRVLQLTRDNVSRTARILAISRGTLYGLLERLGLPRR